jgi:hypothetical protein
MKAQGSGNKTQVTKQVDALLVPRTFALFKSLFVEVSVMAFLYGAFFHHVVRYYK